MAALTNTDCGFEKKAKKLQLPENNVVFSLLYHSPFSSSAPVVITTATRGLRDLKVNKCYFRTIKPLTEQEYLSMHLSRHPFRHLHTSVLYQRR